MCSFYLMAAGATAQHLNRVAERVLLRAGQDLWLHNKFRFQLQGSFGHSALEMTRSYVALRDEDLADAPVDFYDAFRLLPLRHTSPASAIQECTK